MFGYIYKTTNKVDGKIYIGQKKSNMFLKNAYHGSGLYLLRAVEKYGKENFETHLIEWCETKEKLDERERYWIKTLNTRDPNIGYNIAEGGEGSNGGGFKGHKHTEETINKISNSMHQYNQTHRKGKKMVDLFPGYVNGMKGKTPKNTGCIKIYNPELDVVKYMGKNDSIDSYPGFRIGGRKGEDHKSYNLAYTKNVEYLRQLKERFKGTRFIHNDELKKCIRVKENILDEYLKKGWKLGRVLYNKNIGE